MRNLMILILDAKTEKIEAQWMQQGKFYRVETALDCSYIGAIACRIDDELVCFWKNDGDGSSFERWPTKSCEGMNFVKTDEFCVMDKTEGLT